MSLHQWLGSACAYAYSIQRRCYSPYPRRHVQGWPLNIQRRQCGRLAHMFKRTISVIAITTIDYFEMDHVGSFGILYLHRVRKLQNFIKGDIFGSLFFRLLLKGNLRHFLFHQDDFVTDFMINVVPKVLLKRLHVIKD